MWAERVVLWTRTRVECCDEIGDVHAVERGGERLYEIKNASSLLARHIAYGKKAPNSSASSTAPPL